MTFCCKCLSGLFELDQKLQKYQLPPSKPDHTSGSAQLEDVMETNEDDSVFSDTPSIKQEPGTGKAKTPGEGKGGRRMSVSKEKKPSTSTPAPTAAGNVGEAPSINITSPEGEPPYYHWCGHHQSVLLQLCCIVQTLAIKCPTAFITIKVSGKAGMSRDNTAKATTPLSQLPLRLFELPMPKSLDSDLQKKVIYRGGSMSVGLAC